MASTLTLSSASSSSAPVDLIQFDEIRSELSTFTARFDLWMAKKTDTLMVERKTAYMKQLSELRERVSCLTQQLDSCQEAEIRVLKTIERERNEIAEMTSEVEKLHEVALDKKHFADQLQARVAYLQAEVEKRKKGTVLTAATRGSLVHIMTPKIKALREKSRSLNDEKNEPMLRCFEERLALYIDGVESKITDFKSYLTCADDVMKFIFTCIDEQDPDREFYFKINVAEKHYRIVECEPDLPNNIEGVLESKLNSDREFFNFLKDFRHVFVLHCV